MCFIREYIDVWEIYKKRKLCEVHNIHSNNTKDAGGECLLSMQFIAWQTFLIPYTTFIT